MKRTLLIILCALVASWPVLLTAQLEKKKSIGSLGVSGSLQYTNGGGGGGGTPTFVRAAAVQYDPFNASRAVTLGTTTAGNCIVVVVNLDNASTLSVTDNKDGSYTRVYTNGSLAVAVAPNTAGGSGHIITCNVTSDANPGNIVAMELSNIASSSPYDVGANTGGFLANISVTTPSTSQASEMLIGAFAGSVTPTAGSGFTIRTNMGFLKVETKAVSSSGAQTINFVNTESTCDMIGVTLKGN